jgi:two-component system OmpR family sensor kinase
LSSVGAWFLAGGALRPMERMRRQAAELQAHDPAGGLAVPTTKDEVARLAVTLNELLARQHAALQRERDFVADAGHELRTPLTVLKGELELASRPGRSRAELTQMIATVSQETDRLVRLAEDLLDLSGEHRAGSAMTEFDLSDLLRAAVDTATSWATASQVTLAADVPSRLMAHGHPLRLRQAVDNLLNNAIKMSPPAGTVSVTAYTRELDLCVEVCDEGPGFPPAFLPIAFDRFTRSDQARTRSTVHGPGGGSGLGLSIVKAIMDEHHGMATAQNNQETPGARLLLSWPGTRR